MSLRLQGPDDAPFACPMRAENRKRIVVSTCGEGGESIRMALCVILEFRHTVV
ncbi:MAG: hypothetical protein U5K76_06170 [Woeseiaceae bacterium]|nr:hypothetical protein [Woeseiaceae bacterium]